MFSKYSETRVPPNYGGSRFKKSDPYETETKTHRPSEFSAVKSSVSPSFEQAQPVEEIFIEEEEIIQEENEQAEELTVEASKANAPEQKHSINELFNNINAEDLLIICLIIFLSADKSLRNNDVIILLSLLLCV